MTTGRINQVTVRRARGPTLCSPTRLSSAKAATVSRTRRQSYFDNRPNCDSTVTRSRRTRLPPSGTKHLRATGRGHIGSLYDETWPRRAPSTIPTSAITELGTWARRHCNMRHGVYGRLPLRATSEKLLNGCWRIQRAAQVSVHRRLGPRLCSYARAAASAILGRCSEPTLATGNPIRHTDDTGQAQKR